MNVTPDSFSDGGRYGSAEAAVRQAQALVAAGAEGIDIGGESTRPGFLPVGWREEIRRLAVPVARLREFLDTRAWLSVDTRKASVAAAAAGWGIDCINDVSGGLSRGMRTFLPHWQGRYVLVHGMGHVLAPDDPHPVRTVARWLAGRIARLQDLGLSADRIAIDPGIGFGTTRDQDLALLDGLAELADLGHEVWLGLSRKRIVQRLRRPDEDIDQASWRLALAARARCGPHAASVLLRMHERPFRSPDFSRLEG
ncbi:MAG: dihydropteroate synthase [Kiritimatiellae bacterium]|nr:dihydropteroate synthase [Kiritimatiellia bacterium]